MKREETPLDETRAASLRDEHEVRAEFAAHLAHRVDDLVSEGLSPEAARARALEEFGDAHRLLEETRSERVSARPQTARSGRWEALRQDLLHFLRQLRRSPGFALTAIATLTLGVGASTTIVSVVDAVVLEPLPFYEPDRVVFAEMLTPEGDRFSVAEPGFLDWEERLGTMSGLAAIDVRGATLRSPGEPRSIRLAFTSHDLLEVLGLRPALGRMIREEEDLPGGAAPVAMLAYDNWRTDHAADPSVVGTNLDIDGRLFEVVGVMPPEMASLSGDDVPVYVPLGADPAADRGDHSLVVIGRMADGVTVQSATDDLVAVQDEIGALYAKEQGWSATLFTSREIIIGDATEQSGRVLLAAAALLLLMACVNVANLLMVRATARQSEMGLRAALGASSGRLVRQLFAESALLAGFGGLAGLAFAWVALPLVKAMAGAQIPRLDAASLDGTALVTCLASVAGASFVCGLAPVVQLRARSLGHSIGAGRRGSSDPGSRLRALLVGAQVAAMVVLLAGAGLLLRSFAELAGVDPGFEPQGTLAVRLDMPDAAFSWEERGMLFPRIREAVTSVPGVIAVGATATDPFGGGNLSNFVARADRMPDRASDFTPISWRVITPGFFEAMGMDILSGRGFTPSDSFEGLVPVVIGRSLARSLFSDADPIDRVLVWGDPDGSRLRVVGVVEDLRDVRLDADPYPIVYRAHSDIPWATMVIVARVQGDPGDLAQGIRARIQSVAPGLPVADVRSLEDNVRRAMAEPRFNMQLMTSFAIIGLIMAVLGIYGLTAFEVRRRFREIGIRLSLGAEPDAIRAMIVRERLTQTAVAAGVGVVVAWALTRWIESQLYGVTAGDALTWLAVLGVVAATSTMAAYLPARKATQVHPRDVLNGE